MKFKYIGGKTYSEHHDPLTGVDERQTGQGVDLPDSVTIFGHKFIIGQTVELKQASFRDGAALGHAIRKLQTNRYFEEVKPDADDVDFVEVPAPKKRGPKPNTGGAAAELETA